MKHKLIESLIALRVSQNLEASLVETLKVQVDQLSKELETILDGLNFFNYHLHSF